MTKQEHTPTIYASGQDGAWIYRGTVGAWQLYRWWHPYNWYVRFRLWRIKRQYKPPRHDNISFNPGPESVTYRWSIDLAGVRHAMLVSEPPAEADNADAERRG